MDDNGNRAELQHYADVRSETERVSGWHIDRTIPIALVFAIMVQTAGAFWWAANVTSRVEAAEAKINSLSFHETRITRVETLTDTIMKKLDHIDNQIDELAIFIRRNEK
jgi:hypothetical protein